jgi:hypothetical protein
VSTRRVLATCILLGVGAATLAAQQHTGSPVAAHSTPAKPAAVTHATKGPAATESAPAHGAKSAEPVHGAAPTTHAAVPKTAAKSGAESAKTTGAKTVDKVPEKAATDAHAAGHDGPPSNPAQPGSLSDVKTAVARIQQRVLEVMVPKPTAKSGGAGHASGSGATSASPTPRPPSVQLTWRMPLGWPVDLVGDTGVPTAERAVQLTWE